MNSYPAEALSGANPADLAWFEGNWVGQVGDDRAEERWSGYAGNSIAGMMRWVQGDRVKFYELLVLEQERDEVRLRIKHFNPGLRGWEEKDEAHEWVLVYHEDREAAFRELNKPERRFAVYRMEGADKMLSYFTEESREPLPDPGVFVYLRT